MIFVVVAAYMSVLGILAKPKTEVAWYVYIGVLGAGAVFAAVRGAWLMSRGRDDSRGSAT